VLATVFVLAAAATGVVVLRPGPVSGWLGGTEATPGARRELPEPEPSPVLASVAATAPMPTAAGVLAAIDPLVTGSGLGPRVNVSVLDVATGQSLYARGADVPTLPASTTKLITAVAVLEARGPAYRIPTRVVAGAGPGEVVLVGGGDPTLAINGTGSYSGAARLDQLAGQVKQALGGAVPTKVTVDSSLFSGPVYGPGWDDDIPNGGYGGAITALMTDGARIDPKKSTGGAERTPTPDLAAGRSFAKLLGLPAAAVSAVARGSAPPSSGAAASPPANPVAAATGAAAAGPRTAGTELGQVESPPMIRLVDFMLSESDNIVAESLARQVALTRGQPASFTGAAAAMNAVLADLGLPAAKSGLVDGSGLSRTNRITPALLAGGVALAANGTRPELASLVGGLPVAGWSGTLDGRYRSAGVAGPGAGVVRAKTGTLTGVHSISGVVTTADGRLLAFAILADQVPFGGEEAQPKLDKIATTLAGCGCR
jgi:D-alanyl-D-alanine carboxypeptidase/D-alanyl-D-alanine-endopeptidase (penicillin-binding protein 4)